MKTLEFLSLESGNGIADSIDSTIPRSKGWLGLLRFAMSSFPAEILLGTVLLEPNRWTAHKTPSFRVSEWMPRIAAAGFAGIELWGPHVRHAAPDELEAIGQAEYPVFVYSSYASLDEAGRADRTADAGCASRLRVRAIKYNVGSDPEQWETYQEELRSWRTELPDSVALWCECHPGTILEEPAVARRFFDELALENHGVIVHPISHYSRLGEWLELFQNAVRHAHLQMRGAEGGMASLADDPDLVLRAFELLRKHRFNGSMTLEFTAGIGDREESPERLFAQACRDLAELRSGH